MSNSSRLQIHEAKITFTTGEIDFRHRVLRGVGLFITRHEGLAYECRNGPIGFGSVTKNARFDGDEFLTYHAKPELWDRLQYHINTLTGEIEPFTDVPSDQTSIFSPPVDYDPEDGRRNLCEPPSPFIHWTLRPQKSRSITIENVLWLKNDTNTEKSYVFVGKGGQEVEEYLRWMTRTLGEKLARSYREVSYDFASKRC